MEIPDELASAFAEVPAARAMFERLPPSHQREHVAFVSEASEPERREQRARETIEALLETQGTE